MDAPPVYSLEVYIDANVENPSYMVASPANVSSTYHVGGSFYTNRPAQMKGQKGSLVWGPIG